MLSRTVRYRKQALGATALTAAVLLIVTAAAGARPASHPQAPTRILLLYDMEGASGIVSGAVLDAARPDSFAVGRAHVIDDVNDVVAGLFDAGATLVDIENMHGGGGDSLIPRDRLDARASILAGARRLRPYVLGALPQDPGWGSEAPRPPYDAVVTVAMHDKPKSGGFSPHTLGAGLSPIIDGRAVTETELVGYGYGAVGIPVVFASGDDRLRSTLASAMPWVEYAVVKRITTPTLAESLPHDQVRRALRDGAARAVRGLTEPGRMRVMRLEKPFRAGLLPSYPLFLPGGMGSLPGIEKHGDTITFIAKDYASAYWGMFVLQRIARAFSYERTFLELGASPDSAVFKRAFDSLFARASAFEKGTWKPQ